MATQTQLLPQSFHLDSRSREAGRRGVAKARAALSEVRERTARQRDPAVNDEHQQATAA